MVGLRHVTACWIVQSSCITDEHGRMIDLWCIYVCRKKSERLWIDTEKNEGREKKWQALRVFMIFFFSLKQKKKIKGRK